MKRTLPADIVDEGLATDLVVRLQDVVDFLHDVLIVAHGTSDLSCAIEGHHELAELVCIRVFLDLGLGISLAASLGQ